MTARRALLLPLVLLAAGCGSHREPPPVPTPIGVGPRFLPPPVGSGSPDARFRCTPGPLRGRYRVHLELFAQKRVVIVPARVGVGHDCRFPLRTLDPTGVIELDREDLTLAGFFAVWRMPLGARRLLTFRGPVTAFVGGERWNGAAGAIPLRDGAEIVVETGGYVRPHRFYLFPPR